MVKKLLVFIIILIIIAGGFFYWWEYIKETPPKDWGSAEISAPENYVVKDGFVENKKDGLRFEVPEGWTVKQIEHAYESGASVELRTPLAVEKNSIMMEKGCRISIEIMYIKTNFETLKKEILENSLLYSFIKTIDPAEISGEQGLRYTAESSGENLKIFYDEVMLLVKNKIYSLTFNATLEDREHCSQEFDKFLESVSIN